MNLTIDVGNTSAKIAVFDQQNLVFFERVTTDWHTEIGKLHQEFNITACALSNVARENDKLKQALKLLPCPTLQLHYTSPYAKQFFQEIPTGLGADRLAADIAASVLAKEQPFLVIDAGTCLTFDMVNEQREFVGGSISPGVELRLMAMHEHTAALPQITVEGELCDFGYDTPSAMRSGALNGIKYEIEGYIRMCLKHYPDLKVFYTGGNIFTFADDVNPIIETDPLLVLRGLNMLL
ncbi:MAG: type III pantothenate kinase [Bacteroidaceae bacterium]|nr:type III pantothenate kinase [Bacteroidaceae bacterium]